MTKKKISCQRCKGEKLTSLGKKVFECEECGYIFKEFDDSEDVTLKMTELDSVGNITDSRLYECMSEGETRLGKLRTFGLGKLHISVDSVTPSEAALTFHYRDSSLNRTVTIHRGEEHCFEEKGFSYNFSIC